MTAEVRHANTHPDEDTVHDLRVSIRRLRECLRTFEELYPPAARKEIRKELKELMKTAERVRSADIAVNLLKKAGMDDDDAHLREIGRQRAEDARALGERVALFSSQPFAEKWRRALGI
jgi:CHAD domain-containing protein